jgi:hypothetical protein
MHERLHCTHRIRSRRRAAAAASLTLLAAAAISGCATAPPPAPEPVPTPSLTQEQQDDQAFEDVMTRYDALDPNTDTEADLETLLTGSVLEGERESLRKSRDAGETVEGLDTMSGFLVTDRGTDKQQAQYMTAQVCLDVSGTRIRDSAGTDVTPSRDPRLSLQVKAIRSDDGMWRISDIVRNEDVHACA